LVDQLQRGVQSTRHQLPINRQHAGRRRGQLAKCALEEIKAVCRAFGAFIRDL
jgi:hypothetical protein